MSGESDGSFVVVGFDRRPSYIRHVATPALSDAITSALQNWNQGQQQAAIEALRPLADADEREPLILLAWFMSQMGQPHWNDGMRYARRAAELGMPQALTYYFNQFIGDANYRAQTPEIARSIVAGGWALDPLPNAPGAMQQNDPGTAVALVRAAATPRPTEEALSAIVQRAEADLNSLRDAAGDVAELRARTTSAINEHDAAVGTQRAEVEQRGQSLLDLIDQLTSAQATTYFEEEATTYGGEAKTMWWGGLGVVVAAALVPVVPLAIYYVQRIIGQTPWITGRDVIVAHTTAAIALGAVAGVLLARARGRDRARQRNRDLSVALRTMFVYAEQIQDPAERQAFLREMGRTIIESFLRHEPASDADRTLLAALRSQ
jgi:hypothetical protein